MIDIQRFLLEAYWLRYQPRYLDSSITEMNDQSPPSASSIVRFWERVPVVVRAIVVGFFVFAIVGSIAWTAIMVLIPAPWSIGTMAIVLWVYLRYVSGSWWPEATTESRKAHFRATKLPVRVWKWGLMAALLAAVVLESSLVVTFRFIEFPAEAWTLPYDFADTPIWLVWLILIMAALVAGITEEVGFRGYMQVPLEGRYGPVAGITIVSIVFVMAHLNQAWAGGGGILIMLFGISAMWGILARVSGSLIPGMISHTVADIANFSYWWTDVAGTFDKRPISETGVDIHFIMWIAVFMVSLALFALAARKTLTVRQIIQVNALTTKTY